MYFASKSGVGYCYDNNSGQIFCCINKDEKTIKEEYLTKTWIYEDEPIKIISSDDVKKFLKDEGNGFKQLIFELTSQCNFRCKYCCYSECYEMTHGYSNDFMTFETAKKAIDYYVEGYRETLKRNPLAEPFISFYGGEPLLNFEMIKQIIAYLEEKYPEISFAYNITTNGLLLKKDIYDYLVIKDVAILVSLDGNEKDHDRNRVDAGGNSTFSRVMKNINDFRKDYPQYLKFSISACYDWKSDIMATKEFFEKENLEVTKFSLIDSTNTNYYDRFTQEDIDNYNKQIRELQEELISLAKENKLEPGRFVYQALGVGYLEFAYHMMIGDSRNSIIPYTGTCIPGEKIYVTPDGKYHVCEKINPNYSIGNIDIGLDFEKIAEMINDYNKVVSANCVHCDINKLCSKCFTKFSGKEGFTFSKEKCAIYREETKRNLSDMMNLLEANPGVLEKLTVGYYDYIMKHVREC